MITFYTNNYIVFDAKAFHLKGFVFYFFFLTRCLLVVIALSMNDE